MNLIVVRHGETEGNVQRLIQGHTDGVLSRRGRRQARQVGLRLKDEQIDTIYVSDLRRTVETAEEIIRYHPHAAVVYTPQLREQWYGTLEGKPSSRFLEALEESGSDILTFIPEGGESVAELKERIVTFFNELKEKEQDNSVLLVTHGGPIGNLLLHIFDLPNEKFVEYHPQNAAITILKIADGKEPLIRLLNSTAHLDDVTFK
jgi:broad specificity phosphatase PhoE